MRCYSVQPKHQIFVKGYGFLSFSHNTGKVIAKNICENLSDKYRQKLLDHATQSTTDLLKNASKKEIQKLLMKLLI